MPVQENTPCAEKATGTAITWILRAGVAGCFIGHGAFGVITKAAWLPYFAVGGVGESWAWRLMPWIGWMDITIGILALLWPSRALFGWAIIWATWTALLRPLAGEPVWEALERAGNYGVPLAMLTIVGVSDAWFGRLRFAWTSTTIRTRLAWTLRLTTFTLLVGHAGLGYFSHKAGLARHYTALGVPNPTAFVPLVGAFEFLLAALVLVRPGPALLLAVCFWKIATEALFPFSGAPLWELIERFGSYTAPLALALLLTQIPQISAPPKISTI
jgi:hypothetical protein